MGFNHGEGGGIYPPNFWEGGDGQCFHPPLEMNEALAHLSISIGKFNYNYFLMDFH